jgi:hypothetical protein
VFRELEKDCSSEDVLSREMIEMYKKQLALFINYIWMEYRSAEVFQKYEVTHHKGGVYT